MFGFFASAAETRRLRRELKVARALSTRLLQTRMAEELAAQLLRRHTRDFESLRSDFESGTLTRGVLIQKTTDSLAFYRRLVLGHDLAPRRILEIGVKGGGSLLLWRALFPQAAIVGLDVKPPLTGLPEGVVTLQGDQSDAKLMKHIGRVHGPFDLVVDDGSHVSDHQRLSFVCLARHLSPGALYVIEDLHAVAKSGTAGTDYGDDVWGDFVRAVFRHFQKQPLDDLPLEPSLRPLVRRVTDMTLGPRQLALRIGLPAERFGPAPEDGASTPD